VGRRWGGSLGAIARGKKTRPLLGRLSPGWSLSARLEENPSDARALSSDRR
jgi:hypothetical protein